MDNQGKIFQIGFNRCGTTSIHHLFDKFTKPGIPSIHWDLGNLAKTIQRNSKSNIRLLTGYENYTVFSDMEYLDNEYFFAGHLFKQLDEQYPNSKFILNTRAIDKWFESRLNHKDKTYIDRFMKTYSLSRTQTISVWEEEWKNHHNDVIEYFRQRPNDMLMYDIENDDLSKINAFFPSIKFTTGQFPHISKATKKQ